MCGIFALLLKRPLDDGDIALGRAGTKALTHRGPDGSGEYIDRDRGVYLGHRRLKIIDLSDEAAQPMQRDGQVIAYNGEIYNYREVRAELETLGVTFGSASDTEVLLESVRQWGSDAFERLDGMFAFVAWDGDQAMLAVDRFGEKQLFIAETRDGVYLSSELAPLVRLLRLQPTFDGDAMTAFLALGYAPAPLTFYPQVQRLVPAGFAHVRAGELKAPQRYWRPPAAEPARGAVEPLSEKVLDRLHEALVQSLESRLVSDRPLCLFLSNGVDSSLIAALAARDLKVDLECLTVQFSGSNTPDESEAAGRVARHLGLRHRRVDGDEVRTDGGTAFAFDLFGQPNDNLAVASVQQVAAAAAKAGFTVGLTGNGGDELFYGYKKQQFAWRNRSLYGLPQALRLTIGRVEPLLSRFDRRFAAFRDLFAVPDPLLYLALKNQPAIHALRRLDGIDDWARRTFTRDNAPLELTLPLFERDNVLPGSQLPAVDLGGMRASVELRTPFLNHRLFETVAEFDPRAMLAFGQKSVARRLLARFVPEDDVEVIKKGFVFPMSRALPAAAPAMAGLPGAFSALAAETWPRRHEYGWQRVAVRLAMLTQFPAWIAQHAETDAAA